MTRGERVDVVVRLMGSGQWGSKAREQCGRDWGLTHSAIAAIAAEASRRIEGGSAEVQAAAVGTLEHLRDMALRIADGDIPPVAAAKLIDSATRIGLGLLGWSAARTPPSVAAAAAAIRLLAEQDPSALRAALQAEEQLVREALGQLGLVVTDTRTQLTDDAPCTVLEP
jgi:hypothetical protein